MLTRSRLLVALVFACTVFAWRARGSHVAAEPTTHQGAISFTTERVIVFKDGYGLFVKEGTGVTDGAGHLISSEVPEAVLGTLWATGEGHTLRSTTAAWVDGVDQHDDESDCVSTVELLRANIGKVVTLHLEKSEVTGKVVKVLDNAMVVLDEAPGGRLVLAASEVKTLSGKELGTQCHRHTEVARHAKQLVFDFGEGAAHKEVKLHLIYFTSGVRWIPTYRVETGDGSRAGLTLQAEVLNEVEDLRNTTVDLVVGVPNFRFKDTPSPLSLESAMRTALASAAPHLARQMMSNSMSSVNVDNSLQASSYEPAGLSTRTDVMTLAPDMASEGHQDLFSYTVKNVSLPKGARTALPLWSGQAAQRHLYTVEYPLVRNGNGQDLSAETGSPLKLEQNNVWHQLEVANASEQPWTTGAALVMQGFMPLAQEILGYTSPGAKALLPLTIAVNLRATREERELDRKTAALVLDTRSYALIHKQGTITLTSHRADKSTVHIHLATGGEVGSASDDGHIKVDEARAGDWSGVYVDPRIMHHSDVSWEVALAPGQTKTLTYKLSLYQ